MLAGVPDCRNNPLGQPWLYGNRLYCPGANYGGIFVFPLDGSKPEFLSPETSSGMPTGLIDSIALLDDGMLALSSGQESYVLWYDLKTRNWETIAASMRVEKKTLLDYNNWYLSVAIADSPRHRIFMSQRQYGFPPHLTCGLYEFDTRTHAIAKRFAFPQNGPYWIQNLGREASRCFPAVRRPVRPRFRLRHADERWQVTMSNVNHPFPQVDAKPMDDPSRGPVAQPCPLGRSQGRRCQEVSLSRHAQGVSAVRRDRRLALVLQAALPDQPRRKKDRSHAGVGQTAGVGKLLFQHGPTKHADLYSAAPPVALRRRGKFLAAGPAASGDFGPY